MTAPLARRLAEATREVHRAAERSRLMSALIRGSLPPGRYVALLRNLHVIYDAMEAALDRQGEAPAIAPLRAPRLYRRRALARDLDALHGPDWRALAVVGAARRYASRLAELGDSRPHMLAAHAYVRYLGDLSGGQLLREIVGRTAAAGAGDATAFYDFGDLDPEAEKASFRATLDSLPLSAEQADEIVAEAARAFRAHVELFAELDALESARV